MKQHKAFDVKVFIEHVEIPIESVSIQQVADNISTCRVSLPSISGIPAIKARSLMHVGVSVNNGPYILQFAGETTEPSVAISRTGAQTIIVAFSFDNHWDAIPVYIENLLSRSAAPGGGISSTSPAAGLLRVMGSSIKFVVVRSGNSATISGESVGAISIPGTHGGGAPPVVPTNNGPNPGESTKNKTATTGGPLSDQISRVLPQGEGGGTGALDLTQALPKIFVYLYNANDFWIKTGTRTGMSSENRYYYKDFGLFEKYGKVLVAHFATKIGTLTSSNMNFRTFFNLYKQLTMCYYAINHSVFSKHLLLLTGFENVVPPACNIIFPHNFSSFEARGKSLATPTRAIAIAPGGVLADKLQDRTTLYNHTGLVAMAPKVLNDIFDSGNYMDLLNPVTEEEQDRGIIAKQVFLSGITETLVTNSSLTIEDVRGFLDYYISDIYTKISSLTASSSVECDYLPYVQAGLPVVIFKPLHNLRSIKGGITDPVIVITGVATSVQHIISKGYARTIISLENTKVLGSSSYPRPVPIWMQDKSAQDFDGIYSEMIGCNSIMAHGDSGASGSSTFTSIVGSLLGGGASASSQQEKSFDQDIYKAMVSIADQYESLADDDEKITFAESIVKRSVIDIFSAMGSYDFESRRSSPIKDYKQRVFDESAIFTHTQEGLDIMSGKNDNS